MSLTDITRKGLLQLICYNEPCEFCILSHYNCVKISGDDLARIAGQNRDILLRKYLSVIDRIKRPENIQAAFMYLSRVKMK